MGLLDGADRIRSVRRRFTKGVRRGRNKREGEAYCFPYGESLSGAITRQAGTRLAGFFKILLGG
jgi:hypothetical protein